MVNLYQGCNSCALFRVMMFHQKRRTKENAATYNFQPIQSHDTSRVCTSMRDFLQKTKRLWCIHFPCHMDALAQRTPKIYTNINTRQQIRALIAPILIDHVRKKKKCERPIYRMSCPNTPHSVSTGKVCRQNRRCANVLQILNFYIMSSGLLSRIYDNVIRYIKLLRSIQGCIQDESSYCHCHSLKTGSLAVLCSNYVT